VAVLFLIAIFALLAWMVVDDREAHLPLPVDLRTLRVTTAMLLLDSSVPIESVQDLLDHKHIATTQIYDKRRRRCQIRRLTRCQYSRAIEI
jgi:site-specific recombinase XerD